MDAAVKDAVIRVEQVSKVYALYQKPQDRFKEVFSRKQLHRDFYALANITFDVKRGETVGIVGTNGSGKSTILKIITGVLQPTQGNVHVEGRISALLELGAGFNQEYTGVENIYLNGRMMGYSRREMDAKVKDIIEFAEIGDFINQPVKSYSSGMFARLAFAVAINVNPDILIVDEALSVGDLFFQNKCYRKFEELKSQGVTILFVSHDISSVRQMCSRVIWIEQGKQIIFDKSDKVCDMYMDHKRLGENEGRDETVMSGDASVLRVQRKNNSAMFPALHLKEDALHDPRVHILSAFLTTEHEEVTRTLRVENAYIGHVVFKTTEDMEGVIAGLVFENNKGLPLYDFNNLINSGKSLRIKNNEIYEICFRFTLPRIMRGRYVMAAALAQGPQEAPHILEWLHGVAEVEVVNTGFNSSYIEIPADVYAHQYDPENVSYMEDNN